MDDIDRRTGRFTQKRRFGREYSVSTRMMSYVQSSYTELNDRYQMRIFDRISASALGRKEPNSTDAA